MKTLQQYFENENKPTITVKEARELLNDYETPDDRLQEILLHIQQYCEIVCAVFQQIKEKQQTETAEKDNIRYLNLPDEEALKTAS